MSPVFKTDQLITVSVKIQGEEEFFSTFIYARNLVEERRELWEDICHHKDSPLYQNKAWLLMGDFNEILDVEESSGLSALGRKLRVISSMKTSAGYERFRKNIVTL